MENYANNFQTTLNGAITSGATTLVVTSATGAPSANFRIIVDSEIMLVTGVSGTTFTVSRGQEGTTAASHASGATLTHILTAAALTQILSELNKLTPLVWVLGAGTPLTTGTSKASGRFPIPYNCTIVKAQIGAETGPTGAALIVDINVATSFTGSYTSIWNTTQSNRLQIAAAANEGSQTTFDTTAVAAGSWIDLDVDQVGSTVAGQDVVVVLWVRF